MDVNSGAWETLASFETARYGHFSWADPQSQKIYIACGATEVNSPTPIDTIEVFDTASGSWSKHSSNFSTPLFGASPVVNPKDQNNVLIVGGSTGSDLSSTSSSSILKISCSDPSKVETVKTMRTGRTFAFPILTNFGKNLFIIGGCSQPQIDVYDLENEMKENDLKEIMELEEYLFDQLGNYTKDFSFSSCSYA